MAVSFLSDGLSAFLSLYPSSTDESTSASIIKKVGRQIFQLFSNVHHFISDNRQIFQLFPNTHHFISDNLQATTRLSDIPYQYAAMEFPPRFGSHPFECGIKNALLSALVDDEILEWERAGAGSSMHESSKKPSGIAVTRPIVIHVELQVDKPPHTASLVALCYAFALARRVRDRMRAQKPPTSTQEIRVEITEITADDMPFVGGNEAYEPFLRLLCAWSEISYSSVGQSWVFSDPSIVHILPYVVDRRHQKRLGPQFYPKDGTLLFRAPCPVCGQVKRDDYSSECRAPTITFRCMYHGQYALDIRMPDEAALLGCSARLYNLLVSMVYLLDTKTHHIRVTGGEYAGAYQEMFLYRPLAQWSAATLAAGRTPHIFYAPVIADWRGRQLSESRATTAHENMTEAHSDNWLCVFQHIGDGSEGGLRRIWEWMVALLSSSKRLMLQSHYSVEYLNRIA